MHHKGGRPEGGSVAETKTGTGRERKPNDRRRWVGAAGAVLVIGIVAFVASAQATDAPAFCATCHEMKPYYVAWTQGRHRVTAQCVDCHVDAGFFQGLAHKPVALLEVWAHFTGFSGFPMASPPDVPDSRCLRCHPTVKVKGLPATFSHPLHAKQAPCATCHATTGHDVSVQALRAAGIYNADNAALRARARASTNASATPGAGRANVAGHVAVVCSRCHDMAATGCPACHTPPHEPRGDCLQCHKPGPRFTFAHPPTQMENWQSIACKKCHPVSYRQVNCTCHGSGVPQGD
jgi:hypothetical protein